MWYEEWQNEIKLQFDVGSVSMEWKSLHPNWTLIQGSLDLHWFVRAIYEVGFTSLVVTLLSSSFIDQPIGVSVRVCVYVDPV